ncbi:MAG: Nif3-like dinuclear metal center hexameric protein [Clostridia bacterium]|nr:Nif3-like dinuclear metal center hexameric protein [Clostridia bacterium]
MTVLELFGKLEEILPPDFQGETDCDGAQCVPFSGRQVKKVLVALDPYGPAVETAVNEGFDLLLTHHPLIFWDRIPGSPPDVWFNELYSHGVAQFSFHLRLDNARGGVNDVLAELIGLNNVTTYGIGETPSLGRVGNLAYPLTVCELAGRVKDVLGAPSVRYTELPKDRKAERVAVLGGASTDFIEAAKAAGADAIVGGEFKHHAYGYAAGMGIAVVEAGHYYTEDPVCGVLASLVRRFVPDAEVKIIHSVPVKEI